mgnify:CR=1 FL=1
MSNTLSVRLDKSLSDWLADTAKSTGVPQGKLVRDQLKKLRAGDGSRAYMRWAGYIKNAPRDLSIRKGFAKR